LAQHLPLVFPVNATTSTAAAGSESRTMQDRDQWFTEEVRPLEPALRAYLRRRYPTMLDVDDVVQESFLKTFLAWQRGRLSSVRGFLFTVAGHVTVSLFRRRKFLVPLPVNELPAVCVIEDDANVVAEVCSREELLLITEAIAGLPERCRQVAVLRILRGCDCRDIARELGISEQTVRVQLSRAMKKCTDYFRDRCRLEERQP
jgi:RNA polymerase sigma-70 factor (ECF subfamily)